MSSVWPFVVLKQWRRRNTELEFTWGDQLNAALPTYTNPTFSGPYRRNKITGDLEPRLSKLRLWPKRLVLILVHTTLAIIMVVFIATMVTLYATQARANRVLMGIAMGFIVNFPISFLVSVIAKLFARWMNYPTGIARARRSTCFCHTLVSSLSALPLTHTHLYRGPLLSLPCGANLSL